MASVRGREVSGTHQYVDTLSPKHEVVVLLHHKDPFDAVNIVNKGTFSPTPHDGVQITDATTHWEIQRHLNNTSKTRF